MFILFCPQQYTIRMIFFLLRCVSPAARKPYTLTYKQYTTHRLLIYDLYIAYVTYSLCMSHHTLHSTPPHPHTPTPLHPHTPTHAPTLPPQATGRGMLNYQNHTLTGGRWGWGKPEHIYIDIYMYMRRVNVSKDTYKDPSGLVP